MINYLSEWAKFLFKRYFVKPNGVGDNPDPRDYKAVLPKGKFKAPDYVDTHQEAEKIGFEITKQSKGACTAYSKGHGVEIENTLTHEERVIINKELIWEAQMENGATRETGDWIQNAENQFHKNPQGFPQTEYFRIRDVSVEVLKKWLSLIPRLTIRSGIYWKYIPPEMRTDNSITNFDYMKKHGVYCGGIKILSGHAVTIVGFDDETQRIKFIESEKIKWGDNKEGVSYMPYDLIDEFMSFYVSRDCID